MFSYGLQYERRFWWESEIRKKKEDRTQHPGFQPNATHAAHAADASYAQTTQRFVYDWIVNKHFRLRVKIALKILQRKKKKHRFGVKDIFRKRAELGGVSFVSGIVRWDHESFKSCFRPSPSQFDYILRVTGPSIRSVIITDVINFFPCRRHDKQLNFSCADARDWWTA